MKKVLITVTILISFLLLFLRFTKPIKAESLCPPNMPPESREYLDYLRRKLADVNKTQSSLTKKLANEQYQQLSLQEKITYIDNQISETEKVIDTLHMEITAQDIEIKLLSKEIQLKEDDLSLLEQEINTLKETVNKRVTESYKYSYISTFELFLDIKNFDEILRRTKYLIETRAKDKASLEDYASKSTELEDEEEILASKKADLQIKRNSIEEEKVKLINEKNNLASQKAEKDRLLAQSIQRGKQLLAQIDQYRSLQSSYDNAIMEYVAKYGEKMADYGWVSKGTPIGYVKEGSSGCSTGTHLHFSIDTIGSSAWDGCGKLNTFGSGFLSKSSEYWTISARGWKYYYISSGSMRVPLGGTVILTGDERTHSPSGSCTSPRYAIDITSTLWSNIPVYAAMEGNLRKGVDRCGDQYAVIENPNTGIRTAYFHMKR